MRLVNIASSAVENKLLVFSVASTGARARARVAFARTRVRTHTVCAAGGSACK